MRSDLLKNARKALSPLEADLMRELRKQEAEGGCALVGLMSSIPIAGKHLHVPSVQMQNRGNGKGGGIAAVGLVPEEMGVPASVLEEDYIVQMAYLDPNARKEIENELIFPNFKID